MTLREARREKVISQAELAKKVGVTQGAVSRWENGYPPLKKYRAACARALGVSENEIFAKEGNDYAP